MGLTAEDDFILRVVQLSELLAIRHCVFLMGPTGSGRTEVYRVLAKAMQKVGVQYTMSYRLHDALLWGYGHQHIRTSLNPADYVALLAICGQVSLRSSWHAWVQAEAIMMEGPHCCHWH
jgi:hypothetical protein